MDLFDLSATLSLDASAFDAGVERASGAMARLYSTVNTTLSATAGAGYRWGSDLMTNFIAGVDAKMGALQNKISGVAALVKSYVGFSEPEKGPLSDFHTYAPDMMELFARGIRENEGTVRAAFEKAAAFAETPAAQRLPAAAPAPAAGGAAGEGALQEILRLLDRYLPKLSDAAGEHGGIGALDAALGQLERYADRGLAV